MNRKTLIRLFQDGMRYPPGKHRVKVSKVFEITVHPDEVVELDEYEGFLAEENCGKRRIFRPRAEKVEPEMFHVGKSILDLRDGEVVEEPGGGWPESV